MCASSPDADPPRLGTIAMTLHVDLGADQEVDVLDLAREGLLSISSSAPQMSPDLDGLAGHRTGIGHIEVTDDSELAGIDHAEDRIG